MSDTLKREDIIAAVKGHKDALSGKIQNPLAQEIYDLAHDHIIELIKILPAE